MGGELDKIIEYSLLKPELCENCQRAFLRDDLAVYKGEFAPNNSLLCKECTQIAEKYDKTHNHPV